MLFRVVLVHLAAVRADEEPAGHARQCTGGCRSTRMLRPPMDASVAAVCLAVVATMVGATIQGGIGFGMNLVTVPILALFIPESLPATAVLLGIPISIAMLRHEFHALDRRGIGWIMVGRVPGSILGAWVVATVTLAALQAFIGVVVLLIVGASLLAPPIPARPETQVTAGAVSGVTGTAAGIGGPPIALLYQHHPGPAIRSTLAASFFFGTLLSIATLSVAGKVGWDQVILGVDPRAVRRGRFGARAAGCTERSTAVGCAPRCLVFAAISAVVVILDAAL